MNTAQQQQEILTTDTSDHRVLTMERTGTPSLCRHCFHPPCMKRRREMVVPCTVCESRIIPGEKYRVLSRIDGEVVDQVHETCERRRASR